MTICLANDFCKLTPFVTTDINQTYVDWLNDRQVNRFLESRFDFHTLESVSKQVMQWVNNQDIMYFAIRCPSSGNHVGNIKLGPINRYHLTADIGYMIGRKEYLGRGMASNALILLSDYAFKKGIKKIVAGAYETNLASIRVMEKAGYVFECVRKSHVIFEGNRINSVVYAKYIT